jgi:hypothetical protein
MADDRMKVGGPDHKRNSLNEAYPPCDHRTASGTTQLHRGRRS